MKRALCLAAFLILTASSCLAGGEKKEGSAAKPDTVFQKLGDFITGEYEVEGKPLKQVGVLQVTANEINKMKPSSETTGD